MDVVGTWWSIIPPLLTIILAIVTKEVLLSLFLGVFTGSLIIANWNPLHAMNEMITLLVGDYTDDEEFVISGSLTDPWNVEVLIICIMLGGLIGLMVRSGGSLAFGELLSKRIKTKKGAQTTAWLIGIMIFFDDYFNALTNGSIMRPITDKYGVSREKLSYIVDSTSVGICLIVPISSWVAFITSLIADSYRSAGIEGDPFKTFVMSIPYNYYAILSILMVMVVIIFGMDFGPMAKAEKRTKETGEVCDMTFSGGDADEDDFSSIEVKKGKANDLLAPILLLILLAFAFMLWTGGFFGEWDFLEAVNNMDGMLALVLAISLAVIYAIISYAVKRLSTIKDSLAAFVVGTKSMIYVLIILAFAWSIGGVCAELGTDEFVGSLFSDTVPAFLVPLIIFAFSCAMTFSTGASWGTFAIMLPIAIPLAVSMDVSILACITAVIGGGGFGNHCSPLADTAILSSASSNIRHTDHIKTQIPYSVTCALCAFVGYILSGLMDNFVIPLVATLGVFMVAVFILSRLFGEKRQKLDQPSPDSVNKDDSGSIS